MEKSDGEFYFTFKIASQKLPQYTRTLVLVSGFVRVVVGQYGDLSDFSILFLVVLPQKSGRNTFFILYLVEAIVDTMFSFEKELTLNPCDLEK